MRSERATEALGRSKAGKIVLDQEVLDKLRADCRSAEAKVLGLEESDDEEESKDVEPAEASET